QKSEKALNLVNFLSIQQEMELVLLDVIPPEKVPMPAYVTGAESVPELLIETRLKQAQAYIRQILGEERSIIDRVEALVMRGPVAETITQVARDKACDLIVMITHGYTNIERWFHSSVTEAVMRKAKVPVLALIDDHLPLRFLIPLDGTEFSEAGLDIALNLAALFKAEVVLGRVEADGDILTPGDVQEIASFDRELAERLIVEAAGQSEFYLDELARDKGEAFGLKISYDVDRGRPAERIVAMSARNECDLIAMTTHGRRGISRLLKGSVTETVFRKAGCDLFVIHAE
ncbi:MAG: universal stress protein, partial [Chloroflexota bacterium]